ncbi:MAG: transporter substrate-binding domain-containing protein [Opitutales bacterium]|nr:transporter substrate-binding domain-containing protein [Opitutales bacterium]
MRFVKILALLPFLFGGMVSALAQEDGEEAEVYQVAVRVAPPFVMPGDALGTYRGLSIELWERMGERLGFQSEYTEMGLGEMLHAVEIGEADFAVAALTITPERERAVDFTHPFHTSGLGIAVPAESRFLNWWGAAGALFSMDFVKVVAALCLVLLGTGFILLLFERKKNAEQFGGGWLEGMGASFWWSAVTMTTVGYGDKSPITFWGRVVALYWMFAGIIIISSFTAAIASALTVSSLGSGIEGPDDLIRYESAVLAHSTSAEYLRERQFRFREVDNLEEALDLLRNGSVAAVVHDAPILQYLTQKDADLGVLPGTFQRQDYGIAMGMGNELRQELNVALLEEIQSPWWKERNRFYLGR